MGATLQSLLHRSRLSQIPCQRSQGVVGDGIDALVALHFEEHAVIIVAFQLPPLGNRGT